jgi:primosomal replication protein N
MSRGLNKVMIIGRLGRDPEMRYTPSGRPVTTLMSPLHGLGIAQMAKGILRQNGLTSLPGEV